MLTETNAETVKNNTILVTILPTIIDEDVLEIFFESTKKQGGGPVKNVKIISNKNIAIVEFYSMKRAPLTLC